VLTLSPRKFTSFFGENTVKKYFNIAGPCHPDEHYMIPSESRCRGLTDLIDQKQYFVIHAARQTGKTTLLLDLVKKLNRELSSMRHGRPARQHCCWIW